MTLCYIANARIPTEKAHGVQIMKMCEAFSVRGEQVTLLVPRRKNSIITDPFEYYGVARNFSIVYLRCFDFVKFGFVGFLIQSASFALSAWWYVLSHRPDHVYGRDEFSLFLLSLFRRTITWEAHSGRWNIVIKILTARSRHVVAISLGLRNFLASRGVPEKKIVVAHDAVDMEAFTPTLSLSEARTTLGLPLDQKIALYTGHLYPWKGADTFARAAALEPDVLFVVVGGTDSAVSDFKKKYASKNMRIIGHRPHTQIPLWLTAADVLVLPNTAKDDTSRLYTSPMKLFEYMASGRPIVASRLPSISEVLSDKTAILVTPDDPATLAGGIRRGLENRELGFASKREAVKYTWAARADRILETIYVR